MTTLLKHNANSDIVYDNCQCLSKEGEHMFYCNVRKANSYLKKGIAELVSESPVVFKLLFEPKGKGVPYQAPKENACVVCGTSSNLSRHHVVPYAFRKLMDRELKDHRSDDVVVLCWDHHCDYEVSSRALLNKLLEPCQEEREMRVLSGKAIKAFHILERHSEWLTPERKKENEELLQYMGKETRSDYQLLVDKIGDRKIIDLWKEDFVSWMKSKGVVDFVFRK